MTPPPPPSRWLILLSLSGFAPSLAGAACLGRWASVTSCNDVCSWSSGGNYLYCDLTVNGTRDSMGGVVHAIYSDRACTTGSHYCAFGDDADGDPFCCIITSFEGDETYFSVTGGSFDDSIYFNWSSYNMNTHGGVTVFEGRVFGRPGDDYIEGSEVDAASYSDHLNGDGGSDEIYGLGGGDQIIGNSESDSLYGGAGNDSLEGNGGNDIIAGHSGYDTIYGGTGDDLISGGADDDTLHGDGDDDTVCGDDGYETILTGDAGDDILWGGAQTDTATGGGDYDTCDAESTPTCEATLGGGRPGTCPAADE